MVPFWMQFYWARKQFVQTLFLADCLDGFVLVEFPKDIGIDFSFFAVCFGWLEVIFWIGLASVSGLSFSVGVTSQASDSNVILGRSGTKKWVNFNCFFRFIKQPFCGQDVNTYGVFAI